MIGGRGFLITQYLGIAIHSWDSPSQTNHNEIHDLVGGLERFDRPKNVEKMWWFGTFFIFP